MSIDVVLATLEKAVGHVVADLRANAISLPAPKDDEPYSRTVVRADETCEVMIARWRGTWCAPHDHGGRRGFVRVVKGRVEEKSFGTGARVRSLDENESLTCGGSDVHALRGDDDTITVHAYAGPDADFRVYSEDLSRSWTVPSAHGAWLPKHAIAKRVIWIGFTTKYRGGSKEFARAADTLARAKRREFPNADVRVFPLELKSDFTRSFRDLASECVAIEELHFIGHSGMYGIMFGSTKWPEQMSPHEWRELSIPFATNARAYFHACRT
ncbi:MAG: hypothetical protein ACREJX_13635, partial [Polyangiaceae bacterium]